jgi:ABC-type antimicrobial peptide transport system permease subunit
MLVAFWAGRGLEAALAGVPATDLVTFVSVAGLVGLTTLVGSMIPAVRATRIDPVKAIRAE